jgi:hypothetical protein
VNKICLKKWCQKWCLAPLLLLASLSAGALDFGLAAGQSFKVSNEGGGSGALAYTPLLNLWASGPLGERFYLHLSGKIGFEYGKPFDGGGAWRDPAALPELARTELDWQASPALRISLGRRYFQDPAGLAAAGLFDGLAAGFNALGSRFSGGVYYTGLLYKDTADIVMTGRDQEEYAKPLALDKSYFASRRVLVSLDWENPGLSPRSSLALGLLGQFDVNEGEDRLHSQYLSARYGRRLPFNAGLEAAAALGVKEVNGTGAVFFAGLLEGSWRPPGALDHQLSLRGLYSSPAREEGLSAFAPLNALPQGQVFSPALSGLSFIRAAYTLRPRRTLSLGAEASYFIRTDTVSFRDNLEPDKLKAEGYFLGGELYGSAAWTPLPDLVLTLGGGAFFPRLGNAFEPEAKVRWKAVLGLVVSL